MSPDELGRILELFKTLANESRLKLLSHVSHQERSVEELASLVGLKAPTVSHHLARLKAQGLVSMRAEGNTHLYSLDQKGMRGLQKEILSVEKVASLLPQHEDPFAKKVLQAFMEGDKLLRIPSSRKKRKVILDFLVEKFEHGRRYPEAEVNEIIQVHHWDSATLRREMIAWRLMAREAGIYWRLPEGDGDLEPAPLRT